MFFDKLIRHPGTWLFVAAFVVILIAILAQVGEFGKADPNIDNRCVQKPAFWGTLYATGGFLLILGAVEYFGGNKLITGRM